MQNPLFINKDSPWLAIIVFLALIIALPFYESKRFSIWESQEENPNLFTEAVLIYSSAVESFKNENGLVSYFEKDQNFWKSIKASPLIFAEADVAINIQNIPAKEPVPTIPETIQPETNIEQPAETPDSIKENTAPMPEEKSPVKVSPEPKTPSPTDNTQAQTSEEAPSAPTENILDNLIQTTQEIINNTVKKEPPFKILIMGDSFMAVGGGLGDPLERSLMAYQGVSVNRFGRVSSGLTTPNYFNWNATAESLVKQYNPNVAVVMFGANDGQGITSSTGKVIPYNYTGWAEEYAKKVGYFVDILEKNNTTIFWIGVPIMKSSNLSNKMSTLNTIYEAELKNHTNAYFIPTWEALADENGKYTAYLKDANGKAKLIRTSDGVHLQYYAGYLISDDIIAKMQETMVLEKIVK